MYTTVQLKDDTQYFIAFCLISWTLTHLYSANILLNLLGYLVEMAFC